MSLININASNVRFVCYNISVRGSVMKEIDSIDNIHKLMIDMIDLLLTFLRGELLVVLTTLLSLKLVSV